MGAPSDSTSDLITVFQSGDFTLFTLAKAALDEEGAREVLVDLA